MVAEGVVDGGGVDLAEVFGPLGYAVVGGVGDRGAGVYFGVVDLVGGGSSGGSFGGVYTPPLYLLVIAAFTLLH